MISKKSLFLFGFILVVLILVIFKYSSKTDILLPVASRSATQTVAPSLQEPASTQSQKPFEQVAIAQLEDFKNINSKALLNREEKKKASKIPIQFRSHSKKLSSIK
jgi:hypothetical protein